MQKHQKVDKHLLTGGLANMSQDGDLQEEPSRITEDTVLFYTDCRRLQDVQVIALRDRNFTQGFDMLSQCSSLQMAFLQNNRFLTTDLMHMGKLNKLIKLNLSFNQIVTLPPKEYLDGLTSLRILLLDHNMIQKWKNLESLTAIQSLYHLALLNNPVVQTPGYRHFLVTKIPSLLALDDYIITDEERMEDVGHGVRFKALSQFMRLYAPEFKEGLTAEQHLFQVDLEIYKLRRLYEKNSPSIRIQALFKGYKRRVAHTNYFQKRQKSIVYIQKMVRGWLQRLRIKRELRQVMKEQGLEYLVMTQQELEIYQAKELLKKPMLAYIWRFRLRKLRNLMALKIQRTWRMYKQREYSFIRGLELEKYPVVYFLKEQRIRFNDIIQQTCKKLKNAFSLQDITKNFISEGSEFQTLRYPDYTEFPYQIMPLLHFAMPSALSKVLPNRSSKLLPQTKRSIKYMMCQYGPDHGSSDYQRLCKLQPRQCGVDYELMLQEIKERTPQFDRYEDFDTLFLPTLEFAKALAFVVKEHNMMYQGKQILIFFKAPLRKVAAAVTIQTAYRHYLWRREQAFNQRFQQTIIRNRASLCMQAWWRSLKLTRRIKFLSSLKSYLSKIDRNVIYLEETMYLELPRLIRDITQRSTRFVDQYVAFAFEPTSKQLVIKNLKVSRFETNIVPLWVLDDGSQFSLAPRLKGLGGSDSYDGYGSISSLHSSTFKSGLSLMEQIFVNDLMAIFHFTDGIPTNDGSTDFNTSQAQCDTQVKDFNQIVNYKFKSIDLQKGLKFIEMKCSSVQEARKRALLLGLLTFYFKKQFFIKVFTQKQLEEGFFLQTLKDMWIAYDIDFGDIEARFNIKQFGELTYDKQVKDRQFIISDAKDRFVAEYMNNQSVLTNTETHVISVPTGHAMVPDRIFHLIHPKFFFAQPSGKSLNAKITIPAEPSQLKYSTLEDGFSSNMSLPQDIEGVITPSKNIPPHYETVQSLANSNQRLQPVTFDVKIKNPQTLSTTKRILMNKKMNLTEEDYFSMKSESLDQSKVKFTLSHQASPLHTRGLNLMSDEAAAGAKDNFERKYLGPPKKQINSQNFREHGFDVPLSEGGDANVGGSLLQTKKKVKQYIDQINQQLTETKKQEITQIRDFRQYVKLIGNELQQQQLQEFISFKKEQKTLISGFLTREKDRKLFENLNKRLTAIEIDHLRKKKREEADFSKNITAQMNMLNRVNIQSMRRKEQQKKVKEAAVTIKHNMSIDGSPRGSYGPGMNGPAWSKEKGLLTTQNGLGKRNMSQQVSPRDTNYKMKIMDLNDTFLINPPAEKQTPLAQLAPPRVSRYPSVNAQQPQFQDANVGQSQVLTKPVFNSARQSAGKGGKEISLIRQYERNHEMTDSKGRLQSQKEFMIFDESVQLPAFPKKITRNAFERSYMKRIINVKMNEFSPVNKSLNQNIFGMNSQQNESFLLSNSYSQDFPYAQSRGSTSGDFVLKPNNEISTISPIGGTGQEKGNNTTTLQEDSLFKPSMRDVTLVYDTPTQGSINVPYAEAGSPSLLGISINKVNLSKNAAFDHNATISAGDDPTTYRTGGGASTARQTQQYQLPFNGGGSVHHQGEAGKLNVTYHQQPVDQQQLQFQNTKLAGIKGNQSLNLGVLRESQESKRGVKGKKAVSKEPTSIWDYNEEDSSRKRIVMPLKKLIS